MPTTEEVEMLAEPTAVAVNLGLTSDQLGVEGSFEKSLCLHDIQGNGIRICRDGPPVLVCLRCPIGGTNVQPRLRTTDPKESLIPAHLPHRGKCESKLIHLI